MWQAHTAPTAKNSLEQWRISCHPPPLGPHLPVLWLHPPWLFRDCQNFFCFQNGPLKRRGFLVTTFGISLASYPGSAVDVRWQLYVCMICQVHAHTDQRNLCMVFTSSDKKLIGGYMAGLWGNIEHERVISTTVSYVRGLNISACSWGHSEQLDNHAQWEHKFSMNIIKDFLVSQLK